jgi:hypothetical protein
MLRVTAGTATVTVPAAFCRCGKVWGDCWSRSEVARDAAELLRGGGASLSGPPLERRRRAALRQAKPEDAAAQVVAILLARSLVAQYQRRLMCICVSTILTN